MILDEYNATIMPGRLDITTSAPIILRALLNRTMEHVHYSNRKTIIPSQLTKPSDEAYDVTTSHGISAMTSLLVTTSATTEVPGGLVPQNSDSSIMAKMTALLVITAVVLVISYRFVVRLFLGYADRKDDVLPDGLSDDEEDSAVVKRVPERYLEI